MFNFENGKLLEMLGITRIVKNHFVKKHRNDQKIKFLANLRTAFCTYEVKNPKACKGMKNGLRGASEVFED
jgi:hypothetical protein